MAPSSTLTVSVFRFLNLLNRWSLFIAILIWPFGHLLKFSSIYLLDLAVFFVFVSFAAGDNFIKIKKGILFKSLNVFWFSLLLSILISLWQQELQDPVSNFLYFLRVLTYPFLAFSCIIHKSKELKLVSSFSALIFVFLALLQYLVLPDLRVYKNLGFDDHYYRLAGTLLDPNFTGAILATLSVVFLISKNYLTSLLFIASLALTFSRASYLSFLVTLVFLAIQKKYLKLLWLIPLLGFLIYISPKPFGEGVNLFRTYSISSRFVSISQGLQIFTDSPVIGKGFGQLRDLHGGKVSVDNSYVYLLAGSGLMGLVAFFVVLNTIFKSTKNQSYIILLPILLHSLFNNSFFYIWIMAMFWVLVGYLLKGNKSV